MSMLLMVKAMTLKLGNPLRKLVLIKLCDQANDDGECWPSLAAIAEACEATPRAVQGHLSEMEKMGILSIQPRYVNGRQTSNVYTINFPSSKIIDFGVNQTTGGGERNDRGGAKIKGGVRVNEKGGEEPVIKNQSMNLILNNTQFDFSSWPYTPSQQVWKDWLAMRKTQKATVSQTVIDRLGKVLTQCVTNGFTVDDCLSLGVLRNWRGLELDWVLKNAGQLPGVVSGNVQFKNSREKNADRNKEIFDYNRAIDF